MNDLMAKLYDVLPEKTKPQYVRDMVVFKLFFNSFQTIREVIIKKAPNGCDRQQFFASNIKLLRRTQVIAILSLDYLHSRYGDMWSSHSIFELFVIVAHREKLLAEHNLHSANLTDQVHESLHYVMRSGLSNFSGTDALQRTLNVFSVTFLSTLVSTDAQTLDSIAFTDTETESEAQIEDLEQD